MKNFQVWFQESLSRQVGWDELWKGEHFCSKSVLICFLLIWFCDFFCKNMFKFSSYRLGSMIGIRNSSFHHQYLEKIEPELMSASVWKTSWTSTNRFMGKYYSESKNQHPEPFVVQAGIFQVQFYLVMSWLDSNIFLKVSFICFEIYKYFSICRTWRIRPLWTPYWQVKCMTYGRQSSSSSTRY